MKTTWKFAIGGFVFGTLGLFVLSGLSLAFQFFELISTPFMFPGRMLARVVAGENGTDLEVVILMLCNGLLYALVFVGVGKLLKRSEK